MTAPQPKRQPVRSPRLRVVRRSNNGLIKRRAPRRVIPIAVVGVIVAAALVSTVLLEQIVLAQSAFKLANIRKQLAVAEARHESLLLRAARLESPDRIERVARTELGMVNPAVIDYLVADVRRPSGARLAHASDTDTLSITGGAAAGTISGDR